MNCADRYVLDFLCTLNRKGHIRVKQKCIPTSKLQKIRYLLEDLRRVGKKKLNEFGRQKVGTVDSGSGPTHLVVTFRLVACPAQERNLIALGSHQKKEPLIALGSHQGEVLNVCICGTPSHGSVGRFRKNLLIYIDIKLIDFLLALFFCIVIFGAPVFSLIHGCVLCPADHHVRGVLPQLLLQERF